MKGANMQVMLAGMKLQSPFIIGSGPLTYGAQGMKLLSRLGAGAVVTKTIRNQAAQNPIPHIHGYSRQGAMINSELWSDYNPRQWVEQELPAAVEAGVTVIASIGHTLDEIKKWTVPITATGVSAVELVSYEAMQIIPMAREAVRLTGKPVFVKLSPNWVDPLAMIRELEGCGVAGFTAMDSVGPVLSIDIKTRKSVVAGTDGRGWLTGSAIKPIILHYINALSSMTSLPIIGLGGVTTAQDVIEFALAGSHAVGLCTVLMLRGPDYLKKLIADTAHLLVEVGFASFSEATGAMDTAALPDEGTQQFSFDHTLCTDCRKCNQVCPYRAQHTGKKGFQVDRKLCRLCGLCISVCPTEALGFVPGPVQGGALTRGESGCQMKIM